MKACGITHGLAGEGNTCICPAGHDGLCWTKWVRKDDGSTQRVEWWSKDGEFWRHHTYNCRYRTNAVRAV